MDEPYGSTGDSRVLRGLLQALFALVGGVVLALLLTGPADAAHSREVAGLVSEVAEPVDGSVDSGAGVVVNTAGSAPGAAESLLPTPTSAEPTGAVATPTEPVDAVATLARPEVVPEAVPEVGAIPGTDLDTPPDAAGTAGDVVTDASGKFADTSEAVAEQRTEAVTDAGDTVGTGTAALPTPVAEPVPAGPDAASPGSDPGSGGAAPVDGTAQRPDEFQTDGPDTGFFPTLAPDTAAPALAVSADRDTGTPDPRLLELPDDIEPQSAPSPGASTAVPDAWLGSPLPASGGVLAALDAAPPAATLNVALTTGANENLPESPTYASDTTPD